MSEDTTDHQSDPAPPSSEGRAHAQSDSAGMTAGEMAQQDELPFENEELSELWEGFRPSQRQFILVRLEAPTDKAAAEQLGWSKHTPWSWDDKTEVNRAIELFIDEVAQAKTQGLHEGYHLAVDRLKQILVNGDDMAATKAAKLLVEQVQGKAPQKTEVNLNGEVEVDNDSLEETLAAVADAAGAESEDEE